MILLLLGGVGSLVYGSLFHVVAVEEDKEREISIMVPAMSGPGEAPEENPQNPFEDHAALLVPPGMRLQKVTEKYVESSEDPEWAIVREVTFGGVVRLANGDLKRTYSGKPPALCPS
jgi:hypothetical protein